MNAMRRSIGMRLAAPARPRAFCIRAAVIVACLACGRDAESLAGAAEQPADGAARAGGVPAGAAARPGDVPVDALERPVRIAVETATAGGVRGVVLAEGVLPEPATLSVDADSGCLPLLGDAPLDDVLLISGGRLANVVVHVSAGLEGFRFEPSDAPAEVHHRGCRLVPRVTAVMIGQSVRVHNDDPLLHATALTSERNATRRLMQPPESAPVSFGFRRAEPSVRIGCDVHPWTAGTIAVLDNPCFAVTGADGSYEIRGLPPGRHVLQAWHELLGTRTVEVDVAPATTAEAPAIVFRAP
jgi:hypothetical protein